MNSINSLVQQVAVQLTALKWQLACAESCTGGLVSAFITELPGSSSWFERGFVTYSNLAKQEMLAVSPELIAQHGAVSLDVASAMALGALKHSAAHIALSVTGIAGPDGGAPDKPVGTVCFAWATRAVMTAHTVKKQFTGSRQEIRLAACHQALEGILTLLP